MPIYPQSHQPAPILPRLEFGSCYVYSKEGRGQESDRARKLRDHLKRGNSEALRLYAVRIRQLVDDNRLPDPGADTTFVPVPSSSPLVSGALWVPFLIATRLRAQDLGRDVVPLLRRTKAVKKSAYCLPSERPDVYDHFDSMDVDLLAPTPTRVLLIDDVVTAGTTLLASASRIAQAFPDVPIRAFAVLRNKSKEIVDLLEPCVGEITLRGTRGKRRP